MVKAVSREVLICQTAQGKEPFIDWLRKLDPSTRGIVRNRIDRIESGLFGDTRGLQDGIFELKIDYGPGYRVYFGQVGNQIHLIGGGSKRSQRKDIAAAKKFWKEHD